MLGAAVAGAAGPIEVSVEVPGRAADVNAQEVSRWIGSTTPPRIVDIREPVEHETGRIPGSLLLPAGVLKKQLGPLTHASRNTPLLIYGSGAGRDVDAVTHASARVGVAAAALRRCGFRDVRWLRGGFAAWVAAGYSVEGHAHGALNIRLLRPEELSKRIGHPGTLFIVDARASAEYAAGHIPGAVSVPFDSLAIRMSELPHNRDILLYCGGEGCPASEVAARTLLRAGYDPKRIFPLDGGYAAWVRGGFPSEPRTPGTPPGRCRSCPSR